MDPSDHAEFEVFARAHPRFQDEVDDLRPAFEWLDHEFEAAGNTEFRLSPARRAELRRTLRFNVVAFRENGGRGERHVRIEAGGVRRKLSRWAAVAAVLAAGSYLGVAAVRDARQERIAPDRIAAVSPVAQVSAQPAGRVYEYPPAYGLNRSEPWRLANHSVEHNVIEASAMARWDRIPEWQPAAYGLDGPRPYYELSITPGMGAI